MLGEAAFYGFLGGLIGIPVGILAGRWAISRLPEMTLNSVGASVNYHLPVFAPFVALAACIAACGRDGVGGTDSVLGVAGGGDVGGRRRR